jgi:hypothetical protein
MPYKYLDASLPITGKNIQNELTDFFHYKVEQEFANATNVYTIQEEYPFGSGLLRDVQVRISQVINTETGVNQGDDWKKLVFANGQSIGDGYLYYFDENWWMVANSETIKSLSKSCVVRRCNNTLRWVDDQGGKHKVPCIVGYKINENRDYSTAGSSLVNSSGVIDIASQLNTHTNKIKPNQRFLFGNPTGYWDCLKVFGGGVMNFINQKTEDNNSAGVVIFSMGMSQINYDTDDLVNGYTDVFHTVYTVQISEESIVRTVGGTLQLTSTVQLNGTTVTNRPVTWSSSNTAIATVNSQTGLVTFVSVGNCQIKCQLKDNEAVFDTCVANTVSYPVTEYQVKITPDEDYVLEGDTKEFSAYLYANGVVQVQAFTFSVEAGNVPMANYVLTTVDGNHFSIKNNLRYLAESLVINCSGGPDNKLVSIMLKGAW